MGFVDFLKSLFGSKSDRDLREIRPVLDSILAIYPELEKLSHDEIRAKIDGVKAQLRASVQEKRDKVAAIKEEVETLDYEKREPLWEEIDKLNKEILDDLEVELKKVLPLVFAVVKDTARRFKENETIEVTATDFDRELAAQGRDFVSIEGDKAYYKNHWVAGGNEITWSMVHYDVQLIGGIVLNDNGNGKDSKGKIAEMATGEGKTLVATLPVFLNALTGNGVHVVTVNDYLAKRDSEWMGPLYMFHGLSVACIDKTQPNSAERRAAYNADITFGTNNEFGFDYLRDNMAMAPEELVQRPHNYAIVDEVDSVLIDDARTPLIIAGPVPKGDDQLFMEFRQNVENVYNAQRRLVTDLLVDAKTLLASEDKEKVKEGALKLYRAYKGLPKYGPLIKFLSQEGVKATMLATEAHYMQDNNREMHIVTDPLYFVIDEKNNSVHLTDKGIDILTGRINDPKFFVLPDIASQLSAVDNEALTDAEKVAKKDELMSEYAVKAERVHTVNQLLKAYTLFSKDVEYVVSEDGKVKIVDEQTGRIMEGRRYSDGLHQAIEAKENVKVEAATQTFATITLQNYFRMYHKLAGMTGTAETEAGEFWDIYKLDVVSIPTNRPVQRIDMNDRVYRTKKEKYNAVIEEVQAMVAKGRPVLVGTTSVEISEFLSRRLSMLHIPHNVLNAKLHQKEADIVAQAGRPGVVTIATNMAGRGTDIKLTPEVEAGGGLAIIGTERHESRRVDRQLRGRAGRQGDKGSSVFYVSFEDDLMRKFVSDTMIKRLDSFGFKEGEMLESSMITKSIENAQKRVEENHFGVRKHLVDYDDVMNNQRNAVYNRRHHALIGERMGVDILNMIYDCATHIVEKHNSAADYDDLKMSVLSTFAMEVPFKEEEYAKMSADAKVDAIYRAAVDAFNRKSDNIADVAYPVVRTIVEEHGAKGLMQVPITDGKRGYRIMADVEEAYNTKCKSIAKAWQKAVLLMTIDHVWKEHLRELDELRHSVQNASYEQKDPLVIYKIESFNLFTNMLNTMNAGSVSKLMRGQIIVPENPNPEEQAPAPQVQQAQAPLRPQAPQYRTSREAYPGAEAQRAAAAAPQGPQRPVAPIVSAPRVGRNDMCPCGSGKKYKNCHGKGE